MALQLGGGTTRSQGRARHIAGVTSWENETPAFLKNATSQEERKALEFLSYRVPDPQELTEILVACKFPDDRPFWKDEKKAEWVAAYNQLQPTPFDVLYTGYSAVCSPNGQVSIEDTQGKEVFQGSVDVRRRPSEKRINLPASNVPPELIHSLTGLFPSNPEYSYIHIQLAPDGVKVPIFFSNTEKAFVIKAEKLEKFHILGIPTDASIEGVRYFEGSDSRPSEAFSTMETAAIGRALREARGRLKVPGWEDILLRGIGKWDLTENKEVEGVPKGIVLPYVAQITKDRTLKVYRDDYSFPPKKSASPYCELEIPDSAAPLFEVKNPAFSITHEVVLTENLPYAEVRNYRPCQRLKTPTEFGDGFVESLGVPTEKVSDFNIFIDRDVGDGNPISFRLALAPYSKLAPGKFDSRKYLIRPAIEFIDAGLKRRAGS